MIATRSISIEKSGWDRRVTPIMVLVGRMLAVLRPLGGGSRIAACSLSTSTGEDTAHHDFVPGGAGGLELNR